MMKLNLAFSGIIVLLVFYIFSGSINQEFPQDTLDVSSNNQPQKKDRQLKHTSHSSHSSNTDELGQVLSSQAIERKNPTHSRPETPSSNFDDNISPEEAKLNEIALRHEKLENGRYVLYAIDELRMMAEENDVLAQVVLSGKISISKDKSLHEEGEYWAQKVLHQANKTGDKILFNIAVENMSAFAAHRQSDIEDYAWNLIGASRGNPGMKYGLEITREKILKLSDYETELAKRMVPVLEKMLSENTFKGK